MNAKVNGCISAVGEATALGSSFNSVPLFFPLGEAELQMNRSLQCCGSGWSFCMHVDFSALVVTDSLSQTNQKHDCSIELLTQTRDKFSMTCH